MRQSYCVTQWIAAISCVWLASTVLFGITADGRGMFRVAVVLYDSQLYKPIQGATLSMKDVGADELKGDAANTEWLKMLSPTKTGVFGDAFIFYHGGFSQETGPGGGFRTQHQVRGVLVIEKDGFEKVEVDLRKYFGPSFEPNKSIPLIELYLKPKAK